MTKKRSTKRQEPGLTVIAVFGLLNGILPLLAILPHFDMRNIPLTEIVYFSLLWGLSFACVREAKKSSSPALEYFHDFNLWKGVALILIGPALLFWLQLLRNYHEALPIVNPFFAPVTAHAMFTVLAVLGFIVYAVIFATKRLKGRTVKPFPWMEDLIPNLAWLRFFFRENGASGLGKSVSLLSGGAYLTFLYLSLISLALPASAVTHGTVKDTQKINFFWATKYGGVHHGQYCLLTLADETRFTFFTCPACACHSGTQVTITHSPIDYFSRRNNSVECK